MKVLLSSIGTRGDVRPILALAREIKAHGQDATICAAPNFREWVESFGISFVPIGPDLTKLTASAAGAKWTPEQLQASAAQSVREQFRVLLEAAEGCDVIVAVNALQVAAKSIAEYVGAGFIFTAYSPDTFPSRELPPARTNPIEPYPLGAVGNRAAWKSEAQAWNARFLKTLNAERTKLGLEPAQDIMSHMFSEGIWLASDSVLGPAPVNADFDVEQAGVWLLADDTDLPPSLCSFLDSGEPPIYFGFGSMGGLDQVALMLAEAARALRRRAVFSKGWGNPASGDLGIDSISIDEVNHSALFARVSVVVHHGGAGTTHAAALAGCPQLVVPHVYDQFYWGGRVKALAIGTEGPARTQLTTESLITALTETLQSQVATQARQLSQRMKRCGARTTAQRLIECFT